MLGFGDGMRGVIPPMNARIRLLQARHGGGATGNLPAGVITSLAEPRVAAYQPVAIEGGEDAVTLDAAEKRIRSQLRHNDRAVTEQDFADLAAATPGVTVGRVEVMPRFRPFQRRSDIPGVVTVMVVPQPTALKSPHPRADRPMVQGVFDHLDARRVVGTEMYAIGVEFVPLSVSVSVGLRSGFAADRVLADVETALRSFLFPVAPGGRDGTGWPRGQSVSNLELEVIAARARGARGVRREPVHQGGIGRMGAGRARCRQTGLGHRVRGLAAARASRGHAGRRPTGSPGRDRRSQRRLGR